MDNIKIDTKTDSKLKEILNKINEDDLKTMFGTIFPTQILSDLDKAIEKLDEYKKYDVPVHLGDIIETKNNKYVVTCIYTDNSVDILSEDAKKYNIGLYGLYKTDFKIVGKLEVIKED